MQALGRDVRSEAERLNEDIQNLLDATRISSDGVKPRTEWADPADIIDSAPERCRNRLAKHRVVVNKPNDLPLIHVDPVMVKQALVQLFDNAAKYSPAGSRITAAVRARDGRMILSVSDEGVGLTAAEQPRIWIASCAANAWPRPPAVPALASGSPMTFIAANGGKMNAVSDGLDKGTTLAIELPVTQAVVPQLESDADD